MCFTQHQESVKVVYSLRRFFCCAIDWLMRHCSGCFGVDVGNFHLTDINNDDDAVLFTDDPTKWDYVFRNFEASAGVMGLHTNCHKTKIRNIGTGDASRTVHIDNQAVETVFRFTYLGSDIDADGYSYTQRYTDAWASLVLLWLNLTTFGVSKT